MPQSLSNILVHIVFSTKNRAPTIPDEVRNELHAYIGGILTNENGTLLRAGSVADHIHLLILHPRTCSPADLVRNIKTGTSKWMKHRCSDCPDFAWQSGYGIFSISPAHKASVMHYIENQEEHHRKTSFQDEFRRLLNKYGIQFDDQYMWD